MKKIKREHLCRFNIAGFSYYDGCIAMEDLKIGTKLTLKREADNRYDKNAVEIYYKDYKLGYIPKSENRIVSKLLGFGMDIFEARIQRINTEEHPEHQIGVILYLVKEE